MYTRALLTFEFDRAFINRTTPLPPFSGLRPIIGLPRASQKTLRPGLHYAAPKAGSIAVAPII